MKETNSNNMELKDELSRYLSFWPYFLIVLICFTSSAYIYLRYADYLYNTKSIIEIVDKSQDSEMALPTAMTIFNRSMINLENEIGVLTSYTLHERVVARLNSNIEFYTHGVIKKSQVHRDSFFGVDYEMKLNIDPKNITEFYKYGINIKNNKIIIEEMNNEGIVKRFEFENLSTKNNKHTLPFELIIKEDIAESYQEIYLKPFDKTITDFKEAVLVTQQGNESDQLVLSLMMSNTDISEEYLNTLIDEFDKDGIFDRQLEYKRTMDFVDSRSRILATELEEIEISKQNFKSKNNLSNIEENASLNINQQINYSSDLFEAKSQKSLLKLISEELTSNPLSLMPINIGLDNSSINELIEQYNMLVRDREKFLISAGQNNNFVKNLNKQISGFSKNIFNSIENYEKSLDLKISNLQSKEDEFEFSSKNFPEKEKLLRAIERELEIKESLFLLLLQKREEAAINYAVVKPSIKIIDTPRSSVKPDYPSKIIVYFLSILSSFFIVAVFLYLRFSLDTKIHTRKQLDNFLKSRIPVIGEIPYINDKDLASSIRPNNSRDNLTESIRMMAANLSFVLSTNKNKNNVILVTSSIKGEGKTLISVNTAVAFSAKYDKVLLLGVDLRNPQIHKFLDKEKSQKGLTDILHKSTNWRDYIVRSNSLDIILSGTIPPNPSELIASDQFKKFINEVSSEYDYVFIDSAPALLVSDTFEISKYAGTTIYVMRSNYTDLKLGDFILENKEKEKLNGMSIVFNSMGNSSYYGYKYGYQYGYQYGYNYGYGYGYNENKD